MILFCFTCACLVGLVSRLLCFLCLWLLTHADMSVFCCDMYFNCGKCSHQNHVGWTVLFAACPTCLACMLALHALHGLPALPCLPCMPCMPLPALPAVFALHAMPALHALHALPALPALPAMQALHALLFMAVIACPCLPCLHCMPCLLFHDDIIVMCWCTSFSCVIPFFMSIVVFEQRVLRAMNACCAHHRVVIVCVCFFLYVDFLGWSACYVVCFCLGFV